MEQLTAWVFDELETKGSIFGISESHFFRPNTADRFRLKLYDQQLETPFGVAAGPHTQMAQNIITAWLCGARFIELKTVQTLDELDIAKPCIDMQDEGYNVEWSQELKVDQSFEEYLRAWVLIHALHRRLDFPGEVPGVIFNMSVGYNLEGIKQPNVQGFLKRMADSEGRLGPALEVVEGRFPDEAPLELPSKLSDNVTVSTMHGCPPDEIGKICLYLMEEWGLHTNVKLNPTLLGPEGVRSIVNDALGYSDVTIPDEAFEHDIKYADAVALIRDLSEASEKLGVQFGVKLCNTLEVINSRQVFDREKNGMMYMSGRPHHAVAVNVAHRLVEEFKDAETPLLLSFAGGADAWNAVDLLCAGMTTVTTCSDVLKPGGYGRLTQYLDQTKEALDEVGAEDVDTLIVARANQQAELLGETPPDGARRCAERNLKDYASNVLKDRRLRKDSYDRSQTKTTEPLGTFDCIEAPCTATCPIDQQVPRYIDSILDDAPEAAAAVIREDNTMGAVLGRACNHACEQSCIRSHYDDPVAIRELKRFAMDHEPRAMAPRAEGDSQHKSRTAVVGGGPCGLSVAYFLGRSGHDVTIFERLPVSGGMVSSAIPAYRADQEVLDQDLAFLSSQGVTVQHGRRVGGVGGKGGRISIPQLKEELGFDFVVIAAGAPRGLPLHIPGEKGGHGVLDGLDFLQTTRRGVPPELPQGAVGVIGGGDVAMDCARTASRLAPGRVSIIYRRTIGQMPAHKEELDGVIEEGIEIKELLSPERVVRSDDGRVIALECQPMQLGEPDASGRRRPEPTTEQPIEIPLGALIVAIGQQPDLDLLGDLKPKLSRRGYLAVDPETLETSIPGIYAGGDLIEEGPATIVKALGDGKRIARSILSREVEELAVESPSLEVDDEIFTELMGRRSKRLERVSIPMKAPDAREGFEEIVATMSDEAARVEASRCLRCDLVCSLCMTVCPNRAFMTYRVEPFAVDLPDLKARKGKIEWKGTRPFEVTQSYQVAVLNDFCNECGNCATFCPTAGRPFHDKPRLFLDENAFEAEIDNAYMINKASSAWVIRARLHGVTHTLSLSDKLKYASPSLEATIAPAGFVVENISRSDAAPPDDSALSLEPCARMYVLLEGLRSSLGFLPL